MILWKDILNPIPAVIGNETSIRLASRLLTSAQSPIAFMGPHEKQINGYVTTEAILKQIGNTGSLEDSVMFESDILRVPEHLPVEFFHNVSVVVGVDLNGEVTGYTTGQHARNKINELQLAQLNELIHGAGIGIVRTNSRFEIEFLNETAERLLGLPRSFLLDRNYQTLLTMDKNLENVLEGKTLVSVNSEINFKQMSGNFYPLKMEGEITGLVHMFFLREEYKEIVQELDFVRHLYADLQAVYNSSNEQILVIDHNGKILRVGGKFLNDFWKVSDPEEIIGKQIRDFAERHIFQPNIYDMCVKQKQKVTSIQENGFSSQVWSVATPVYHEGELEKVVILSRDITANERLTAKKRERQEGPHIVHVEKRKLVYRSKLIASLLAQLRRAAAMNSTILLQGESGTGKEIFASEIHMESPRKDKPFIMVNCGAIPEQLIESELFGYERGAFTGANQNGKAGLFELAHKGTIFLDEIGDLPFRMQVKLLRVLQEREIVRVGGTETIPIDVRVIAATNKDLKKMVLDGEFREDLFYRLHVIPLSIPPLRERKEDIFPLAVYFLEQYKNTYQVEKSFTPDVASVLEMYTWPGNVRELENVVERLLVISSQEWIGREEIIKVLYEEKPTQNKLPMVLELVPLKEAVAELEAQLIEMGMEKYGTAAKVSEVLGVSPATISRRMKKIKG